MQGREGDRVYVHTDKPFYKPSENIWFEVYVRNEKDMKPSQHSEIVHVEFINPKGNIEKELHLIARNGRASGDIALDEEIAGGLYKLKAYTNWQKNNPNEQLFEKEITIQRVVLPNLRMKLDFEKEGYGKGAEVVANLELKTLANAPLANYDYTFKVALKGEQFTDGKGKTSADGKTQVKFNLPKDLDTADGLLNVLVNYNGQRESISRNIPIKLNNISLEIFPEGGEMIVGMDNKIAFRALDEFGKPTDIEGAVYNQKGDKICTFGSYHDGMGSFLFNPNASEKYTIKITEPQGVEKIYAMPDAIQRGYAIGVKRQTKESIILNIKTTENELLNVVAQMRGQWIEAQSFQAKVGDNELEINTTNFPMGVVLFTLFDSKGIERSERLVFVNQHKQMNVEISTDKEKYLPREKVVMTIRTTDERGIGIPASLSLSVVDDKLLSFADDKQGHILSKLLLEPDLKGEIHEPNFYFDPKEEKASTAMDLLMMTQGWRKFAWKEIETGASFTPQFQEEKAIISGYVYDQQSKPVEGAEITISDTTFKVKVLTNKNGEFVIPHFDLYAPVYVYAQKGKLSNNAYLSDYSEHPSIYLYERIYYKSATRNGKGRALEVPVQGGGGRDRMLEEMNAEEELMALDEVQMAAEGAAPDDLGEIEEAIEEAPLLEEKRDDVGATQIAPKPIVRKEDDQDMAKKRMVVVGEEDFRDDIIDKKPVENQQFIYYRARVYPKVMYQASDMNPSIRTDFRSTIHWQGNITTEKNGKATVEFYNNDEITTFRATVEGIGVEGSVGRKEFTYFTQQPFSMSIKVPVEMTMGDVISLPLTMSNFTSEKIGGALNIQLPKAWKALSDTRDAANNLIVNPNESKTIYLQYEVLNIPGVDTVKIAFEGGKFRDAFVQEVRIASKGFPVSIAISGQEKELTEEFIVQNVVEGTLSSKFTVYPSVMSDLLAGVESILREPYGCFEQTSSSAYPNIMVLSYLKANDIKDPVLLAKANDLIDRSYKRLVTFETKEKGYEWFGGTPAHEALTAYGLMEFKDMSQVYASVDNAMVERTANWLFSRKDGKGGFMRDSKALDSFGSASEDVTNAYIVYSLSEAGYVIEIKNELEKAYQRAESNQDPYQMALIVNALFNTKDARAEGFLTKLLKKQQEDGSWNGTTHSITYSTGMALKLETTSLSLLAAMKAKDADRKRIGDGVKFLIGQRSEFGGYGNTQSTVLVLKSLTAFASFSRQTAEAGEVHLKIAGHHAGTLSYAQGQKDGLELKGLEAKIAKEGKQKVHIEYGKNVKHPLPYTFSVNYSTYLPPSSDSCKVSLKTTLNNETVKMGETLRLNVVLTNKTQGGLPMTIAIVGIPAGLSLQPWQLKELQDKQVFDFYEIKGNRLAIYYRQMKPSEVKEINLDLKADIPGVYEGSASSAYLYYTNEFKHWTNGLKVEVRK
ncbi:MAG: hypothetical protein OHK0038_21050 [Flammeovirgaceae bacterium]